MLMRLNEICHLFHACKHYISHALLIDLMVIFPGVD
jgi:hypothetical protein